MGTTTLVCSCGMTLKAAGARPGRVGKCPKCGATLRVPDDYGAASTVDRPAPGAVRAGPKPGPGGGPSGYGLGATGGPKSQTAFYGNPTLAASAPRVRRGVAIPADYGPLKAPRAVEKAFGQSVGYPLWSWSSVALLIFLPPALAVVSAPLPFLLHFLFGSVGFGFRAPALILVIPSLIGGIFVWGYVLIYLGDILTSSACGEPLPPRPPQLDDRGIFRVLGRWFWALFAGVALGFLPAVFYWIHCGEINWLDRLMFVNLGAFGAAYAQMALLAALLHDDPLAANPVTVLRAVARVGWDYAYVCLMTGAFFGAAVGLLLVLTEVDDGFVHLALTWLYWVAFVYAAMVVFRRLGLFCHRHKVVLAWFRDRPTWGR